MWESECGSLCVGVSVCGLVCGSQCVGVSVWEFMCGS